jgi:serine/threonine-protein kinase
VANLALVAGLSLAAYQAFEANRQKERAERHFASVRKLANVFIFDVDKELALLPGALKARETLVRTALDYLRQLSSETAGDDTMTVDLATAYRKVGDIQGRPFGPNIGDPKGARASYDSARALLEPLVRGRLDAGDGPALRELVVVHKRLGALADSLGEAKEGERVLQAGIALADRLVAADGSRANRSLQAAMHGQLSQLKFYSGDMAGYLAASEVEQRWLDEAVARDPRDAEALLALSILLDLRGQYLAQRDDSEKSQREALAAFRRSVALQEALRAQKPDDVEVLKSLATEHTNVGVTLETLKDLPASAAEYRKAMALLGLLRQKDPDNLDARISWALASNNLAAIQLGQGDAAGASESAKAALAVFTALPDTTRQEVRLQLVMARAFYHLGTAMDAGTAPAPTGKRPACEPYRLSLELLQQVHRQAGTVPNQLDPNRVTQAMRGCAA